MPYLLVNHTEQETRIMQRVKEASGLVNEGWPLGNATRYAGSYDLVRDCDLTCHKECNDIKKYAPFETLL